METLNPIDALSVSSLRKSFGDKEVVAGIDFVVPRGTCFGLLGPNGAGKTTTLRCCLGLTDPDAGKVILGGLAVPQEATRARERVGVVPQFDNLDPDFTVSENLMVFGRYFGIRDSEIRARIPELLDFAGLGGKEGARIQSLSGGMKRRLTLARALVNDPDIVFLDEPTTGLDPMSRIALWEEVRRLNQEQGMTVLLTTQYLEEADQLAGRIAIIDNGRIVKQGRSEELKAAIGAPTLQVDVPTGDEERARVALAGIGEVRPDHDGGVCIGLPEGASQMADVVRALDAAGVRVDHLELHQPSLDDVFAEATGRRLEGAEDVAATAP